LHHGKDSSYIQLDWRLRLELPSGQIIYKRKNAEQSDDELLGGAPQPAGTGNDPAGSSQTFETGALPQLMAGGRTGTPASPSGKAAAAIA
jgi:hypothetical protein